MIQLRSFARFALAWAVVTAALSFGSPSIALADNGERVSYTAHASLNEMALSPDGSRVYLVWYDFINAAEQGFGEVYFRYRDAGGWHPALDQPPVNISASPDVHSEQPTMAVDTNGGVHIVWGEGRPRSLQERYLPPGADPANAGAWSGRIGVSQEDDVQNANMAADNAGGVWLVYTTHANDTYDVFARHRSPNGWEGSQNVSRAGGRGAFVGKVAVDPGGIVSVLWWERGAIRYAARTGGWNAPETVAPSATQQTGITVESSGRIHVVYTEAGGGGDGDRRIAYRTRAAWNAPWSNTEILSETGNMLEPRIAWANGRIVATWNDRSGAPARIYVMQNFGNGWRDRQAWTDGFKAFSPWIVQGANTVAYVSFRNADTDQIHFSIYTSNSGQPAPSASPAPTPVPSPAPPLPPTSNPAQPVTPSLGSTFFPETGHNLGGVFRNYWQTNGGLALFGLPLTEEFVETNPDDSKPYTVQYFERARFEYHPENAAPYTVLLGRLGLRQHAQDTPATPILGASFFPETGHNLGGSFRTYWQANGGLAVFGLPITEEFTETGNDGKPYTVQYFERNRFEFHPGNAPPYDVLLGLLGRQELVGKGWLLP